MTSKEVEQHVDSGCPCPRCEENHYQVDQLILSVQDVAHAIWDVSYYHDEPTYVIKVECKECGHVLYNRADQVDLALTHILNTDEEAH